MQLPTIYYKELRNNIIFNNKLYKNVEFHVILNLDLQIHNIIYCSKFQKFKFKKFFICFLCQLENCGV